MDAYETSNWAPLFGAEVSAAAALTGLIFVAVSINLNRILAYRSLPRRAFTALFMLVYSLIVSTLMLVPGQPTSVQASELLVIGLLSLACIVVVDVGTWRLSEPEYRSRMLRLMPVGIAASLTTVLAGASLLAHAGGGVYWLVGTILLAFVAALIDCWVLLIEIAR